MAEEQRNKQELHLTVEVAPGGVLGCHQAPVRHSPSFSSLRLDTVNQPQIILQCQLHSPAPFPVQGSLVSASQKQIPPKVEITTFFGLKGNLAATKENFCSVSQCLSQMKLQSLSFAILPVEKLAQIPPFAARLIFEHKCRLSTMFSL